LPKAQKIYIAGHKEIVGIAIWRALSTKGYTNLIGKTSSELDLRNQQTISYQGALFGTAPKPMEHLAT
jgi:GDP-L-fucose synthase